MRVLAVKVHLGRSAMDVFVEVAPGDRVLVPVTWQRKERSDVPPENWYAVVRGEVELLRTRRLPSQALNNFLSGRIR